VRPGFDTGDQEDQRISERHDATEESGKGTSSSCMNRIRQLAKRGMKKYGNGQFIPGHSSGRENGGDIENMRLHVIFDAS
jgi:hypothetical protein